MAFKNRVIAITGAASGIGLVLAHYLLSHGAKIALADSNRAALHHAVLDLEAKHPGTASRVQPFELDVRKPASLEAWMQAILTKFGRLDGAANLAGITGTPPAHPVRECDGDDWDLILAVNLTGTKNCVKAQLGVMKEGASIVNTASVDALKAVPNAAAYAVSKAGVISLTKTVAAEEGKRGIRVNCIAPGYIDTPMIDALEVSVGQSSVHSEMSTAAIPRKGTSDEVAKVIGFLLSDDSSFITGSVQLVDGGYSNS